MKNRKYIILSVLFLISGINCLAVQAKGYRISLNIIGNEDSYVIVGFHIGDKQYIKDTLQTDSNGTAIFSGEDKLDQGLYLIMLPEKRYFDIIIDSDQEFSLTCSKDDIVGTMEVEGSKENQRFIEYQRKWIKLQQTSREYRSKLQQIKDDNDSRAVLQQEMRDHEKLMVEFLEETSNKNQGSFLSLLVKALIPVTTPVFDIPESQTNPDSLRWVMGYNYNKDHFFDNIDLSDSRLIRTPILHGMLNTYFSRMIIQHPDTVIKTIPSIVEQSRNDSAMFRYIVTFLFNHYRVSTTMGHDGVMVKIIDDYYLSGKADWVTEDALESLKDDANRLRPNLMGVKGANFVMETYDGTHKSLYDIDSEYTIIYFWEPNCGHCKTTTPALKEFYEKNKASGIEVFAVCTQYKRDEWEAYVVEHELSWINGWDPQRATHYDYYYNVNATPLIYILDKNKVIIAKKIGVESIEGIISNHRRSKHY